MANDQEFLPGLESIAASTPMVPNANPFEIRHNPTTRVTTFTYNRAIGLLESKKFSRADLETLLEKLDSLTFLEAKSPVGLVLGFLLFRGNASDQVLKQLSEEINKQEEEVIEVEDVIRYFRLWQMVLSNKSFWGESDLEASDGGNGFSGANDDLS